MNLLFRKIIESDLQMIMEWRTLPEVTSYMYTDFKPDIKKQREWFEKISNDSTVKYWIVNVDGEDVGVVNLFDIDTHHSRCNWGFYLASANFRGKGIGKSVELSILNYVFEQLKLNKFCCEVFTSNPNVIKMHEKNGSIVEGTLKQHMFKNGQFHDIVSMGITREDWELNVKGKLDYTEAVFE